MTVELDIVSARLNNTRDSLEDVCAELGYDEAWTEDRLQVLQCCNCNIWRLSKMMRKEDELPVCTFCADLSLLRF